MHCRTHTKPSSLGQAGRWQSPYHDTMIDHDKNVGELLDLLARGPYRSGVSRSRCCAYRRSTTYARSVRARYITSNTYWDRYLSKGYMIMVAQGLVAPFLETFKQFPPRQKAASFTIDQAMEKMEASISGAGH
jgi:hypothetical protein